MAPDHGEEAALIGETQSSSPCPHSQRPAAVQHGESSTPDAAQVTHSHSTPAQDKQDSHQTQGTCQCLVGGCHLGKVLATPMNFAAAFASGLPYPEAYQASLRINRPAIHLPPPRRSLPA